MNTALKKTIGGVLLASALSTASANFEFAADPLWTIAPGDLVSPSASTERGAAYNSTTGNMLLVSRNGGLNVHVIDGATGTVNGTLDTTGISGGVFALSTIGVGSDGAIYGANLTTDSRSDPFRVYRWADESSIPSLFYSGDPSGGDSASIRFGDNLAVRGSGANTEILAASRAGKGIALIGDSGAMPITVADASAGDFGLGVAFGSGNTFWGTAAARPLRHIDLSGNVLSTYSSSVVAGSMTAIAVDTERNLLAGIRYDAHDVFLYDVSTLSQSELNEPLSIRSFPGSNSNGNGTGAGSFGNGYFYGLETNNGIIAYEVIPEPATYALVFGLGICGLLGFRRIRARRG